MLENQNLIFDCNLNFFSQPPGMPQEYSYCPTEIIIFLVWHPIPGSDLQQMLQQKPKTLGSKWQWNSMQECPCSQETLLPQQAGWVGGVWIHLIHFSMAGGRTSFTAAGHPWCVHVCTWLDAPCPAPCGPAWCRWWLQSSQEHWDI